MLRDYTDSEAVNALSSGAEILFVRLMMKADDYGKFHANPKLIRASLFPLKKAVSLKQISSWLDELSSGGLIFLYTNQEKHFLKIKNFGQRLRSMKSKYPDPEYIKPENENLRTTDSNSRTNVRNMQTSVDNCRPEEKRREENTEVEVETEEGGEIEKFAPPNVSEVEEYFKSKNFRKPNQAEKFHNHYRSNGWKVGRNQMKDWKASADNWIERDTDFSKKKLTPTSTPVMQNGNFGQL